MAQKLMTYQQWTRKYESKQKKKQAKQNRKAFNKVHAPQRNRSLYALELEDDNYYIGMTTIGVSRRFLQHMEGGGKGAEWTKVHKPIRIIEERPLGIIKEASAAILETDMTIEYMNKYGIARVRGGALCCVRTEANMKAYNSYSKVKVVKPANPFYYPELSQKELQYQQELAAELSWIGE